MRSGSVPRVVRASSFALVFAATLTSTVALATPTTAPPNAIGGELRPASSPGDSGKDVVDALLYLPRKLVETAVLASSATVSFFENEQIVPRARSLLGSEDGTIRITPTIAIASGYRPDLGARVSSAEGHYASMVRFSVVDENSYLTEGRMLLSLGDESHTQLVLEAFQQRAADQGYLGLGPTPATDPRNHFLPGQAGMGASFLEARERVIASVAARVSTNVELLLSSSYQRRRNEDSPDSVPTSIEHVFVPGSVPGAYETSQRLYSEVAIRRDSRLYRGPPSAGFLVEGYGGSSQDAHGVYASALHAGGRIGWFIPIVRTTTILAPRFAIDGIEPIGSKELPFREYNYGPGFRGSDGRVDHIAAVASLDYRWQLVNYVAARLFVDFTTVAPHLVDLRVNHLAWAVGAEVDLHSSTTEIGRVGLVYSADAIQVLLSYGYSGPGFGDRQHR